MKQNVLDEGAMIAEYLAGGVTYRQLAKKYECSATKVFRCLMKYQDKVAKPRKEPPEEEPREYKKLRQELELERLRVKLLNAMIDIAEDSYGIPIRKKAGTKQS